MKILVTGSGGLIGSEAVEYYCNKGCNVVGIDNNKREYFFGQSGSILWRLNELKKYKNYVHRNVDIVDYRALESIFKKERGFDLIVHTAAHPSHDWASKEPLTDFNVNAVGTINLLESYRIHSPSAVFIFTSTNKVYGDAPNKYRYKDVGNRFEPYLDGLEYGFNETLSIDQCLHSVFGASKIAADIMVQEYGRYFNLKTAVFRGGCLTGKKHSGVELHGFLSYLVKCCLNDTPYTVFGYGGRQVRDNIHSSDLISAFDAYFEAPKANGEVYNIGGGTYSNCSVLEAITITQSITNKKLRYTIKDENRIGDHKWWISDTRKFKTHFSNWKQIYNIENIITNIVES